MHKKVIALMLSGLMLIPSITVLSASADSAPIVTVGADLTDEQKQTVYDFFNIDSAKVVIVEVNNAQERQYLEGLVPDSVIGTRTISCSYILPTDEGGILVKTANLTWVTDGMIANALLTAGIENCQVICTAPFEVSGTGALTGVLASYEQSSGIELDEEKKALATEELVVTGELVDEIVDGNSAEGLSESDVLGVLNDIKTDVMNGDLSKEEIEEIVKSRLEEYKIELSEATYNKLINYLSALTSVKYDFNINEKLSGLTSKIKNGFDFSFTKEIKKERGFWSKLWTNICNFFIGLFGGEKKDADYIIETEEVDNIFEDVNTEIYDFDDSVSDEPSEEGIDDGEATDDVTEESTMSENIEELISEHTEAEEPVSEEVPVEDSEEPTEEATNSDE